MERTVVRVLTDLFATFVIALTCVCAGTAFGAERPSATLTGTATARDGARLPGVTVRLMPLPSGDAVQAVTNDAGLFRLSNLVPGIYDLEAEISGFEPLRMAGIVLEAGSSHSLALPLEVASVREHVSVVGLLPRDSVQAFEIRESRARDVGEALTVLPGLVKVRKGAIGNDVVLRGLQGKDVTMLIDGQRIDGACPGHMDPPAFHVDFAEVSRVEVSKGPFDVKNEGGLAGTVNVVTERPQQGWHGSANLAIASASTIASSAYASVGQQRWAALAGASARRASPYRDGAGALMTAGAGYRPETVGQLPAYDVWTAWGRVALLPRPGTTLQIAYTRQSADTILYPYLQMDAVFDNADRIGTRFEVADLPGGWTALAANAYYTRVDHWMTDQFRTSARGRAREYSMGTRAGTALAGGRAEIQRGSLSLGAELSRRNWNTTTMMAMGNYAAQAAIPDVTIDVGGIFAAYTADLAHGWRLETGGRVDRAVTAADPDKANVALYLAYHGTTDTRATDLLPAGYARARWRHDSGWSAVFGGGRSTRIPDQQERFYALMRAGSDWVGNPNLSPSRNTGGEGEVRYSAHGIDAGFSGFAYRIDDHILVVDQPRTLMLPGIMNAAARSYENADALMRGIEASGTVPLARSVFASGDLSVVRGTRRGPGGGDLPEIPPARVRLRVRYDNARWNGLAEIVGAARQSHVATELRETPTAAFLSVNLRAGWRVRGLNVAAALDNVCDTHYAEHLSYQRDPFRNGVRVYEPGRSISVNLSARF